MKISFMGEGFAGQFLENGEYDLPIESDLPHRFELKNGVVLDKYDGVSDDEVKRIDHEAAIAIREDLVKAAAAAVKAGDEFVPAVPEELPALDAVSAEDAK
jgi:hypothetical protein